MISDIIFLFVYLNLNNNYNCSSHHANAIKVETMESEKHHVVR